MTLPPMILFAGRPLIIAGRANSCPQFGQVSCPPAASSSIRSTKHFTSAPLPPCEHRLCEAWKPQDARLVVHAQRPAVVNVCSVGRSAGATRSTRQGQFGRSSLQLQKSRTLRYLYRNCWHLAQLIFTVCVGPFLLGCLQSTGVLHVAIHHGED